MRRDEPCQHAVTYIHLGVKMDAITISTLFYSILPEDQKRHFYTSKEIWEYERTHTNLFD